MQAQEILAAPGVGDIVDFRAIPWGWGTVIEAPTEKQKQLDPHAYNVLNRTAQLMPILARLGAIGAKTPPIHFECQHGEGECAGNAMESCLQDIAPNHQQFFPVMDCLESRTCAEGMKPPSCLGQPIEVVRGCLEEYGHGISLKDLNTCYDGSRVQELMIMNDMETTKAKPQWVPWFQIDGESLVDVPKTGGNDTALFREQFLMGKKICDLYVAKTGNPAPPGCATFPQSDAQVPKNPFARFAETNFTSLIAKIQMEKQQVQHATLKRAASATAFKSATPAAAKSTVANKSVKTSLVKSVTARSESVPAKSVKVPTPVHLPKNIQKVKSFADHFFGHDKAHEAMTKKLIEDANKPVVPVATDKLTKDAIQDVKGDKDKLQAFKAVKGDTDTKARSWKPPSTNFI